MKLEELKDVLELNQLAESWIKDYKSNKLGKHSKKLKKQYKEMRLLHKKTGQILDKNGGETETEASDWKDLFEEIKELASDSPYFATCFGNAEDLLAQGKEIDEKATATALKVKNLTSAWFGKFDKEVNDDEAIGLLSAFYDKAKEVLTAPKKAEGDMITMEFYGSKNKQCRKMKKKIETAAEEFQGLVNVEVHKVKNADDRINKLGLENVPAIIFKRGKDRIAKHEGELSISALQKKLAVLLEGQNITDSSSVPSIKDMKSVNKKELYSLGEFLLFYFETPNCGTCKKTAPVVDKYAKLYSNVKFEKIMIDGSHHHHKSFNVTHVPSIVFVRDGVVIGKHVGYINPTSMEKLMEEFSISKKRKMGLSEYGESTDLGWADDKKKKKKKSKK